MAFEAALQLMAQGQRVDCLILFDAATPGYPKVHKLWRRYIHESSRDGCGAASGKRATTAALRLHIYTLGRIFARRLQGRREPRPDRPRIRRFGGGPGAKKKL